MNEFSILNIIIKQFKKKKKKGNYQNILRSYTSLHFKYQEILSERGGRERKRGEEAGANATVEQTSVFFRAKGI